MRKLVRAALLAVLVCFSEAPVAITFAQEVASSPKEQERVRKEKEKQERRAQEKKEEEARRQAKERERSERNRPPSAIFRATPDRAKAVLVTHYTRRGFRIDGDSSYQIAFWKEMTGGQAMLAQMFWGNSYSETPQAVVTFTLAPVPSGTEVTASMEIVVRMPLGKVNRASLTTNKKSKQEVQQVLESLQGEIEAQNAVSGHDRQTPEPPASQVPVARTADTGTAGNTDTAAQLEILSTPEAAEIYLNGQFVGSTPSTISVPAGAHTLSIRKLGYKAWERQMQISTGHVRVVAELEQ